MPKEIPFCPIRSQVTISIGALCWQDRCAWWVQETGMCAVLNISLNLVALGITIEEAQAEKGPNA